METIKALVLITFIGGEPSMRYTITSDFILKEFLTKEITSYSPEKAILLDVHSKHIYFIHNKNLLLKRKYNGSGRWFSPDIKHNILEYEPSDQSLGGECIRIKIQTQGLKQINQQLGLESNTDSTINRNYSIREVCEIPAIFNFLPKDDEILGFLSIFQDIDIPGFPNRYWFENHYTDYLSNGFKTEHSSIDKITSIELPHYYFSDLLTYTVVSELDYYGKAEILRRIDEKESNLSHIPKLIQKALEEEDFDKTALYEKVLNDVYNEIKRLKQLFEQSSK
ncbi:MAG: hypothetical protein AAFO07_25985 [Bacteroidota bacterium]